MEGGLRMLVDYAAAAASQPTDTPTSPAPLGPDSMSPTSPTAQSPPVAAAATPLSPSGFQGSTRRRGPAGGAGALPAREWLPLASRTETQWNEPTLHVRPRTASAAEGVVEGDAVEVRTCWVEHCCQKNGIGRAPLVCMFLCVCIHTCVVPYTWSHTIHTTSGAA